MRLLQVSLRSLLLYSIILLIVSIPVSLISIRAILNEEVDESLSLQSQQFLKHIKSFEYLEDLETDLLVLDQLSYNIHIKLYNGESLVDSKYRTITRYDSIERTNKPFRQLSSQVVIKGNPYLLTIQMSLVDNNDLVMAVGLVQLAISFLLATGLLLLNRSLSKKLWRPFYKTLDQLKAYELDKSESVPIVHSYIKEFNDLNKTVSHLTERNRKIFLQQKEFIENASHELQTPIAIFQSKLDALMQSTTLSQEEAETIMELEYTAKRMAKLNKNLLLLSKIDNGQFMDMTDLDLSSLIHNQLSVLKPIVKLENINITTSTNPLFLKANRILIEILLTNLFHNAIRHSPKNEDITITLRNRTLDISNKGTPFKMGADKMMKRFSKESSDPNSTGLGLAIIKKICDHGNYRLNYRYTNDTHTFSVTF